MKFTRELCISCEGTGHQINYFDLPKWRVGYNAPLDLVVNRRTYTNSGREIYDEICSCCRGTGIIVKGQNNGL